MATALLVQPTQRQLAEASSVEEALRSVGVEDASVIRWSPVNRGLECWAGETYDTLKIPFEMHPQVINSDPNWIPKEKLLQFESALDYLEQFKVPVRALAVYEEGPKGLAQYVQQHNRLPAIVGQDQRAIAAAQARQQAIQEFKAGLHDVEDKVRNTIEVTAPKVEQYFRANASTYRTIGQAVGISLGVAALAVVALPLVLLAGAAGLASGDPAIVASIGETDELACEIILVRWDHPIVRTLPG